MKDPEATGKSIAAKGNAKFVIKAAIASEDFCFIRDVKIILGKTKFVTS